MENLESQEHMFTTRCARGTEATVFLSSPLISKTDEIKGVHLLNIGAVSPVFGDENLCAFLDEPCVSVARLD